MRSYKNSNSKILTPKKIASINLSAKPKLILIVKDHITILANTNIV